MLTAPIEIDGTPVVQVETFLTCDGKALQEGSDYTVDVDPMGEILTIRPVGGTWGDGCYRISVQQTQFDVVIKSTLPEVHELRLQSDSDNRAPLRCRLLQQASVLVSKGSVWKYLDDGTDQGTAWREAAFDDSRWKSGPAELGFGETDQATTISFGADEWNKYPTTYFRHQFDVADPTSLFALQLHVLRDDGVAVYLNGREVFRDNLVPLADHRTYSQAAIDDLVKLQS